LKKLTTGMNLSRLWTLVCTMFIPHFIFAGVYRQDYIITLAYQSIHLIKKMEDADDLINDIKQALAAAGF
jgi:hypothetical protein